MYCWRCGKEIKEDEKICPNCGAIIKNYNTTPEKTKKDEHKYVLEFKRNNFGIASLILSIFSFFVSLYFIVPVTSFILGIIGVVNMDKYTELNKLAAVGFVFSIASIVMWTVLIIEDVLSSPMWMFF